MDEYVVGDVKIEGDNDLDDIINDFGGIEIDGELNKSDVVFFVIDCYHLLKGDFTQFKQAVEGYLGFLKNKIIANPKDKIGLILYSVVRTQSLRVSLRTTSNSKASTLSPGWRSPRPRGSRRLRICLKMSQNSSDSLRIPQIFTRCCGCLTTKSRRCK